MSSTNFRRGQSRVYYASDVWDPGLITNAQDTDEEFARTSFRSSCSDLEDPNFGGNNNEDYVASLLRRNNHSLSEDEFDENGFLPPTYAKPLPILGHPSRHSVLNRCA